jgi:hypothetical protein
MLIPSVRWAKRVSRKSRAIDRHFRASGAEKHETSRADIDWRDALRTTARTFIARRRRLPRGSNSRPGEHEQRRVRVDLAPIAHRAHRFVPAHRCAPPQLPQLRRGGQARSPGDARRRRGRGARHRRRAADQGGPRGLPALGMQAQGAVEVRARRCRSATHDVASGFSAPSKPLARRVSSREFPETRPSRPFLEQIKPRKAISRRRRTTRIGGTRRPASVALFVALFDRSARAATHALRTRT